MYKKNVESIKKCGKINKEKKSLKGKEREKGNNYRRHVL
jgi:hypothetical protein